jgi:hypothetical protein
MESDYDSSNFFKFQNKIIATYDNGKPRGELNHGELYFFDVQKI